MTGVSVARRADPVVELVAYRDAVRRTVRSYEERGLLRACLHGGAERLFTESDMVSLQLMLRAEELGLRPEAVGRVPDRDAGNATRERGDGVEAGIDRLLGMLSLHLEEVESEMSELLSLL